MSAVPEAIQLAIGDLEGQARDHETRAGTCRELASQLRALYDLSPLSAAACQGAPTPGAVQAAVREVHVRAAPRRRDARTERHGNPFVRATVLEFLKGLDAPISPARIPDAVKRHAVGVRRALAELIASGEVVARGQTSGRRVGIPAVMAPATLQAPPGQAGKGSVRPAAEGLPRETMPPARTAPEPKAKTDRDRTIHERLTFIFRTGASYDIRELVRNVRHVCVDVTELEVLRTIEDQVRAGHVKPLYGLAPPRWQKVAKSARQAEEAAS